MDEEASGQVSKETSRQVNEGGEMSRHRRDERHLTIRRNGSILSQYSSQ